MINVRYAILLTGVMSYCSLVGVADKFKKAEDFSRGIITEYAKVFSRTEGLIAPKFDYNTYKPWLDLLKTIQEWINQLLAIERPLGSKISQSNRDAILKNFEQIKVLSEKLIKTIKILSDNYNANKGSSTVISFMEGDLQLLGAEYAASSKLQELLRPGILDVDDTLTMKRVLQDIYEKMLFKTIRGWLPNEIQKLSKQPI